MQRYRVNHKLLLTVFFGTVIVAVSAFFLWTWQVNRKATWFRDSSKVALEEGKKEEAFNTLLKYVQLRRDEVEPRIELANIGLELLEDPNVDQEMRSKAFGVLEETVRRTGDPALRRKFTELIIGFRPQDALTNLEDLIRENPDDGELLTMQAQALYRVKGAKPALEASYKLVGYDPIADKFDTAKAKAKGKPDAYTLLASLLLEDKKDELAARVIDEMVKENPESALAYLHQSIYLRTADKKEESIAALNKAFELDPENADILQQKGMVAVEDEDFDLAAKIFADGMEKHPDRLGFYDLLSRVQIQQEKHDEALKTLDKGLEKIDDDRSIVFVRNKINIYFQRSDYDSVENELKKLEKTDKPALVPFIDFTRARILWQKQEWTEAARHLKEVRPKLIDYPLEQSMAGALLATCYERQGKLDLALQTYGEVLEKNPNYEGAKVGLQALKDRMGIVEDDEAADLDRAIEEMAKLPEAEQNWTEIDRLVAQIAEERDFNEARIKLIQANVMLKRSKFDEAKELIRAAAVLEPDNIGISFAAISLLSADPNSGPEKALALLDKVEKRTGDSLRVRAVRAQLLRANNGENVKADLETLTKGTETWKPQEQAELMATISAQFELLRDYDKAREYLLQTIKLLPDSLPARVRLFELAFQQRDSDKMREAEQSILDLVKDKNDGNYIHSVVRRMLWDYTQQKVMREELVEARAMLDGALKRRPQWHELHVLYGQLLLVLEQEQDLALQHLDDALKYGPPNANALALQVKLLGQRNQMEEARKKMELIPEAARQQLLGRSEAEVLLLTGDKEGALASAKKLAELEAQNPTTQVWFARIANEVGNLDTAIEALNKAVELQPADADIWMQLLAVYAAKKDVQGIEDTLRSAQLSIEGDFLPLLTAKKYELLGDWQAAEKIYLATFSDRLDELPIAQRMAEFYLLWARSGKLPVTMASPYINRILRQANEGKADRTNNYVVWARDQAARLLATSGDYQESLKAQKLLGAEGNLKDLTQQEQTLLADILASRKEPASQLKAINLLSDMDRAGTISKQGVLALAQLLSKSGNWERSQELMNNAIGKFRNDEQVRSTFIDLLIERGEYPAANRQLEELKKVNPESQAYMSLAIKLAAASGNDARLQKLLKEMLPPNLSGALDPKQLERILLVARLATQHEQYELPGQLYPLYIQRTKQGMMEYARFLALHGDPAKAIEILKQLFPQGMDEVLQVCAEMLRARRLELGDKFDADIDAMVATALRDDPDSVRRMLVQAEILESQAKYNESIAKYDTVLKRDDVPRLMRAAAMNNLGFLLTLLDQRTDEAEGLINQALEVYGPVDDILDTRAVVRMARKEYDAAVEDMSLATSLSSDPVKFYHFAQANLLAGNDQAALKAWEKAQQLGFTKEKLPVLERPKFDQVKSEIEGLRTQNAKL